MTGPNFAFIDVLAAFALWTSLGSVDIFQLPDRFAQMPLDSVGQDA